MLLCFMRKRYVNSTENDLNYWGLDYPPLTAYGSYFFGLLGEIVEPQSMEWISSRGYETYTSKLFMRGTVLLCDELIMFPAIFCFLLSVEKSPKMNFNIALMFVCFQPAMMLIDHGHFQYNCVSLGLCLWAIVFLLREQDLVGSVFFCLALNYKHMSLYYAPSFFVFLLGRSLTCPRSAEKILKLSLVVIITFAIIWAPFLLNGWSSVSQVILRLFPIERGLYEDKVANLWCSLSPLLKFKLLFNTSTLLSLSLAFTLIAIIPSCLHTFLFPRRESFLYCLLNTSMGFFLCSFQVHEKSILFPLLPASLMCFIVDPLILIWFELVATFSLYPLLEKDGLAIPYFAISFLFFIMCFTLCENRSPERRYLLDNVFFAISISGMLLIHVASAILPVPTIYPDLYVVLIAMFSFVHFFGFYIYFNWRQWNLFKLEMKQKQV